MSLLVVGVVKSFCYPVPFLLYKQIMSLVGDDVLADVENDDDQHGPAELMTVHRDFDFSDEAPPIPAHTMASMELVEPTVPTSRDSGGGGGVATGGGGGGGGGNGDPLLSTYDVVGATADSVYEQPGEPFRCEFLYLG